jgi:hypothetical protein
LVLVKEPITPWPHPRVQYFPEHPCDRNALAIRYFVEIRRVIVMNRRELIAGGAVAAVAAVAGIGAAQAFLPPVTSPVPEHSVIASAIHGGATVVNVSPDAGIVWENAKVYSISVDPDGLRWQEVGDRRVFYIDCKNMPPEKAKACVNEAMDSFRRHL